MNLWNCYVGQQRFRNKAGMLADQHLFPACRTFMRDNMELLR